MKKIKNKQVCDTDTNRIDSVRTVYEIDSSLPCEISASEFQEFIGFVLTHMVIENWYGPFVRHMENFIKYGINFFEFSTVKIPYIEANDIDTKAIYGPIGSWFDDIGRWLANHEYLKDKGIMFRVLVDFLEVASKDIENGVGRAYFSKNADIVYFDIMKAFAAVGRYRKEG